MTFALHSEWSSLVPSLIRHPGCPLFNSSGMQIVPALCALRSPLCFHTDTKPFSRTSFLLTFLQKPRGCTPLADNIPQPKSANSSPFNHSSLCPGASSAALSSPHAPQSTRRQGRGSVGSSTATLGCVNVLLAAPASTGRSACATTSRSRAKLTLYRRRPSLTSHESGCYASLHQHGYALISVVTVGGEVPQMLAGRNCLSAKHSLLVPYHRIPALSQLPWPLLKSARWELTLCPSH